MKKIILLSLVFGLITSSAFATYYQTTTSDCSDAAMMAELDRATALHRAVVTDVTCTYSMPKPAAKVAKPAYKPAYKPTTYFYYEEYETVVVEPAPTVEVISVVEEESCSCVKCGC